MITHGSSGSPGCTPAAAWWVLREVIELAGGAPGLSDAQLRARLITLLPGPARHAQGSWPSGMAPGPGGQEDTGTECGGLPAPGAPGDPGAPPKSLGQESVMEQWYIRSAARVDAHYGQLDWSSGTVTARCGLVFSPEPALFTDGPAVLSQPVGPSRCGLVFSPEPALFTDGPAVLSQPVGPSRCCPACSATSTAPQTPPAPVSDEDWAAVRGLVETL